MAPQSKKTSFDIGPQVKGIILFKVAVRRKSSITPGMVCRCPVPCWAERIVLWDGSYLDVSACDPLGCLLLIMLVLGSKELIVQLRCSEEGRVYRDGHSHPPLIDIEC